MKKLFLLITMPMLALSFTACDKGDEGGNVTYNKFVLNGQSYELTNGEMRFYGNETENSAPIELYLYTQESDEIGVSFEMNVPTGNNRLVKGTYTMGSGLDAFTFNHGEAWYGSGDNDTSDVVGGKIIVDVANDTYTIDINCTLESGGAIKGIYQGKLNLDDSSN